MYTRGAMSRVVNQIFCPPLLYKSMLRAPALMSVLSGMSHSVSCACVTGRGFAGELVVTAVEVFDAVVVVGLTAVVAVLVTPEVVVFAAVVVVLTAVVVVLGAVVVVPVTCAMSSVVGARPKNMQPSHTNRRVRVSMKLPSLVGASCVLRAFA